MYPHKCPVLDVLVTQVFEFSKFGLDVLHRGFGKWMLKLMKGYFDNGTASSGMVGICFILNITFVHLHNQCLCIFFSLQCKRPRRENVTFPKETLLLMDY